MRWCELTADYPPDPEFGIGVHVGGLVRGLTDHGDGVVVVTRKPGRPWRETDGGIEVLNGPEGGADPPSLVTDEFMADQLAYNRAMHRALADTDAGFDVVHNHSATLTPLAIALAEEHGAKLVTSVHIPDVAIERSGVKRPQWLDRHVMRALEIEGYRRSSLIVSPSETVSRMLREEYPWCAERLVTAELSRARPAAVKERYDASAPLRVLAVSRVAPFKGLENLVRAMGKLGADAARCRVIGGGRGEVLRRLAAETGAAIELAGQLPHAEVLEALPEADLLVAPSPLETYGLVVQEAMSAGVPVVASDIPVFAERITPGRDGILVPLSADGDTAGPDVAALADAIARLGADAELRRRLGTAAARREVPAHADYAARLRTLV